MLAAEHPEPPPFQREKTQFFEHGEREDEGLRVQPEAVTAARRLGIAAADDLGAAAAKERKYG